MPREIYFIFKKRVFCVVVVVVEVVVESVVVVVVESINVDAKVRNSSNGKDACGKNI
jgi:hypothetical protein